MSHNAKRTRKYGSYRRAVEYVAGSESARDHASVPLEWCTGVLLIAEAWRIDREKIANDVQRCMNEEPPDGPDEYFDPEEP